MRRFWQADPVQFNFALMSRAKQVTYENLRKRDPQVIRDVDAWWTKHVAGEAAIRLPTGFRAPPPMFAPFTLRGMTVANRVVVSPMCQYSAVDGTPTDWHYVHYGSRAVGGAGLVVTEMTCVARDARISPGCTGMYKAEHRAAWKRIVQFVHAHTDCRIALQLGHAGRKGSTQLGWEEMDRPLPSGNWPIVAPSSLPYYPGLSQVPRTMSRKDMNRVREQYVAAVKMGVECDFDMLELHMAHGYLLASFISPITNRRVDDYGGRLENRMRFPLEVFDACRDHWPRGQADVGASVRDRLDPGRDRRRGRGRDRPDVQGARLRPHRRLDRPDRPAVEAGLRPDVPGDVLGADPERRRHRHAGGRARSRPPTR